MNKRKLLLSFTSVFIIISLISVIYAFSGTKKQNIICSEKLNNSNKLYICISNSNKKVNNTLSKDITAAVEKYIPTLVSSNEVKNHSTKQIISNKINILHDNTINQDYYDIITENYSISLSKDLKLRSFSDNTFNFNLPTTASKIEAENFIMKFYDNLNVSHDYELAYMEIADEGIWEADFAKKIDGIYNYYDSIKIFFSPEQEKIAALRIHSSEYSIPESSLQTIQTSSLTIEEAKRIVKQNFSNISDEDILNVELVFTKPNNFFTKESGSDIVYENIVTKAWKISVNKDSKTGYIFIDCLTGNIVGGDQIK